VTPLYKYQENGHNSGDDVMVMMMIMMQ